MFALHRTSLLSKTSSYFFFGGKKISFTLYGESKTSLIWDIILLPFRLQALKITMCYFFEEKDRRDRNILQK